MKVKYHQTFSRLIVWFVAEIVLSYVGLDNLADYSEYLSEYLKEQRIASIAVGYCQI